MDASGTVSGDSYDIHVANEFGNEFGLRGGIDFLGDPTWTNLPARMTPMRSLITIASSRLWV